ncbi:glycosyltransferase family 2 protein [Chloroflexota bacterium]
MYKIDENWVMEERELRDNLGKGHISVVVPAYNEEQYIASCLESLKKQDFCGSYEIIVVDNNSEDRTAEIARSFGVRVFFESRRSAAAARQRGFAEAKGDIIATTDADSVLPSNWLASISRAFQKRPKLVAFGGHYNFLDDCPILPRFWFKYMFPLLWMAYGLIIRRQLLFGVNMAVKREAFLKVGGFNTSISQGEDNDISLRLAELGQVIWDSRFQVTTSGRRFCRGLFPGLLSWLPYEFRGEWRLKGLLLLPSSWNGYRKSGRLVAFGQTLLALARIAFFVLRRRVAPLRFKENDDVPEWMVRCGRDQASSYSGVSSHSHQ